MKVLLTALLLAVAVYSPVARAQPEVTALISESYKLHSAGDMKGAVRANRVEPS